mmetsp:Transcript_27196/g.56243  ORF Transcript_27196/g.56243 Transcript_27196/m.56243 type:complete len:751 (+) Transcript_27196:184-2436(+)
MYMYSCFFLCRDIEALSRNCLSEQFCARRFLWMHLVLNSLSLSLSSLRSVSFPASETHAVRWLLSLIRFAGGALAQHRRAAEENKHTLKEKVFLRQRKLLQRFAMQDLAVGRDLERVRIDFHPGQGIVQDHVEFAHGAAVRDAFHGLGEAVFFLHVALSSRGGGHKGHRSVVGAGAAAGLVGSKHGAHLDGLRGGDAGVGVSHLGPGDRASLDDHFGFRTEHARLPQHQIGELADLDAAHVLGHPVRDGRIDRVLCQVAFHADVVVVVAGVFLEGAALALHFAGRLPGSGDHLADAAHGLAVGRDDGNRTHVVENVFGGDRFGTDPALGEGNVLRNARVQVVADHQHVEMLVHGVDGKGPRGVRRAGKDVGFLDDLDDVGGVATAGTLRVVGVDGPSLHCGDAVVDESALVERVGVDRHGNVVLVGKSEAGIDGGGRRPPVLVQLKAGGTRQQAVPEDARIGGVALSAESEVHGNPVGCPEHHLELGRCRSAGRGGGSRRGAGSPSEHGRQPGGNGVVELLGTDEVDVGVDASGREDEFFAGNHIGSRTDDHVLVDDSVHHVGVSGLSDPDDAIALDADVGLDDAKNAVHDQSVRNDHIQCYVGSDAGGLSHALPEGLAPTELALLPVGRQIGLDPDFQTRVAQPHLVADRRAVGVGVGAPLDDQGPSPRHLRGGSVAESPLRHPFHDGTLVGPAGVQVVPGKDGLFPADVHERHGLGLARLEPHGGTAGHVEALADAGTSIEEERLVGL